ncbi:MAG: hypothetical protein ACLPVY_00665 [Acidimicrobiia bacterium]
MDFDTSNTDDPFRLLSTVGDECHDGWIVLVDLDHDAAQTAPIDAGIDFLHVRPSGR